MGGSKCLAQGPLVIFFAIRDLEKRAYMLI